MKIIKIIVCLLLSLVCCPSLCAQDTIMLNQVIVSANSDGVGGVEPLVARKLDTLALQSTSTSSLSQLLIQHSPVFIKTFGPGGTASASFRGTTASHTLVLWNGFQLNSPILGQVDFSTIPVFLADDVNLNWGSGTSSNSGGLGGVVSIDNMARFSEGFMLDAKQSYGSFNTWGSYLTIGQRSKRFSFRVKAFRASSDNDFEYKNIATIPHQQMKQQNASFVDYGLMPEMSFMYKNCILSITSWNQWNHRNLPPIMTNIGNVNCSEWTKNDFSRNFMSFKYFWNTGKLELKSGAFVERQHYFLETRNPFNEAVITSINSENKSLVLHQIATINQQIYRSWTLDAKLQWDDERVVSNNYEDMKRRNVVSAYAAISGEPFSHATLNLTTRYDWTDGRSMGLFPTATFSYQLPFLKSLCASVGYSHNYRNPSLNDLYWYPGGNPDLLPENGRTFDIALKYAFNNERLNLQIRSGAYFSKVQDWIQWMPTAYRFWVPENVALVYARGSENHIDIAFTKGNWKAKLSCNYVFTITTDESENAQTHGTNGKQLIYIPRHHGNLFARLAWKTFGVNYTMEMTGKRSTSYSEEQFFAFDLPAYTLHHISIDKQFRRFNVELKCNNLFDTDYQNVLWRAMPGRNFELILSFKL